MNNSLFTVRIDFEDRTFAIEQTSAASPKEALQRACRQAEALAKHDRAALDQMLEKRVVLTHVADIRGVWLWHTGSDGEKMADIFGGEIVQTDPTGPVRE